MKPILPAFVIALMVSAPLVFAGAQESPGPAVVDDALVIDRLAQGLTLPTAMAFVDEQRTLVLEKDNGTVRVLVDEHLTPEPALDVDVATNSNRGMLGIDTADVDGTIYAFVYFTESGGGQDGDDLQGVEPAGNRLYRYTLTDDNKLVDPLLLLDLPALPGPRYDGGTVRVGPDGFVYVVIGDVEGHTTQAQNFEDGPSPDGTSGILRVGMNGEVPPSVIGTSEFGRYYFAYGIRNSFGMDFDPETGLLWDTENGPETGDEINLVEPGFNSGWRDVYGFADEEELDDLVLFNDQSHYSDPEFEWVEPVGPTALAFLDSDNALDDKYDGDMFVGDILNGFIYHFDLDDNDRTSLDPKGDLSDKIAQTPDEAEGAIFGTGFGGITDIQQGPNGSLYVLSFVDGTIYSIHEELELGIDDEDEEPNRVERNPVQDTPTEDERADSVIDRLVEQLDGNCLTNGDRHKLANAVAKVVKDIFNDNEPRTDKILKTIEKIIEDCEEDNGNNGQGRGRGRD